VVAGASVAAAALGHAQTYDWSGALSVATGVSANSGMAASNATNVTLGNVTNWFGTNQVLTSGLANSPVTLNFSNASASYSTNGTYAQGNFTGSGTTAYGVVSWSGSYNLTQINFDNTANRYPSGQLRIIGNNLGGNPNRSIQFVASGGNIINVTNNSNVTFTSALVTSYFQGTNLLLNYTGTGVINVDGTSILTPTGGNAVNFKAVAGATAGLEKKGTGTLALFGGSANITGNFILSEGTLQIGTNTVSNTTTSITTGVIGTGSLVLAGGTLSSNGTVSRTLLNNVTISGSSVTLGDATNNGPLTFSAGAGSTTTLATNATLNTASDVTIAQNISGGSNSLTKTGSGTLTLSGTNSYTGGTTVSNGTLKGAIGSGSLSVGASGTYDLNSADRSVAELSGAGTIALGAKALTTTSSTNSTFSGTFTGNSGSLNKDGAGILEISGTNSSWTGSTRVLAGGLKMNGTMGGSVTMESGTTLFGIGTFGTGTTVTVNGTHSPGNSPGVQTFDNLTYNSGATVNWELASNKSSATGLAGTDFDQIVVNGTLNFAGATSLNLTFNNDGSTLNWGNSFWTTNQSWVVFDNANAATSFSNLSLNTLNWADSTGALFNTALAGASFSITQSGTDILLNYTAAAIPEPSTYAALAGVAALGLVLWRRRRAAAAPKAD
jgi:autotransporter-associated beta strand protein